MRERLLSILLRPYALALLPTVVMVIVLPDFFQAYRLAVNFKKSLGPLEDIVNLRDLDHDGTVEVIRFGHSNIYDASINVYRTNLIPIDQWNLSGKRCYFNQTISYWDENGNGSDDIFVFTNDGGDIYLSAIDLLLPNKKLFTKRVFSGYVDSLDNDIMPSTILFEDLNNDGSDELIFGLNAGFSAYPRNLFIWDRVIDTLYQSPYYCNRIVPSYVSDLDNDGKKEIYCNFGSSGNATPTIDMNCSDYHVYFTLFDQFAQPTWPLEEYTTSFRGVVPLQLGKEPHEKMAILSPAPDNHTDQHMVRLYNSQKELDTTHYFSTAFLGSPFDYFANQVFLIKRNPNKVFELSQEGRIDELNPLVSFTYIQCAQLDDDIESEWISVNESIDEVTVSQDDFSTPCTIKIDKVHDNRKIIGSYRDGNGKAHIYIQRQDMVYDLLYTKNPYALLRYPFYGGIYLGFMGFFWLLLKGFQYQQYKQEKLSREIAGLQMKAIKNQVDPHFVFNAMNTISSMLLSDDKEQADRFITKFSRFMRLTLSSSDRITTTLEEELSYVKNFLQLQQIRYQQSFTYSFAINADIDTRMVIPKHILFTSVENAVKHGLYHKNGQGHIEVSATRHNNYIWLIVEDNGVGEAAKELNHPYSTGRGLQIMQSIINLYHKLHGRKITLEQIPLRDDKNHPIGMRVLIKLHTG